jgi:hypothetical protein
LFDASRIFFKLSESESEQKKGTRGEEKLGDSDYAHKLCSTTVFCLFSFASPRAEPRGWFRNVRSRKKEEAGKAKGK